MSSRLFATLGLAALIATGAATAIAQAPATIRIGIDVDAGSLDPRQARDTTAFRTVDLIYDGLVQLGPDLAPVPDLATAWENPDPTTWIFKLRQNVKFQDGTPFTADDVVFTFTTILDAANNAPMRALYTPISKVEAVDPQTVKFTLSAPYAPLLSYLDIGIVSKKLAEGGGNMALKPVGTGPMKLASWTRGSKIVLEPNADYWAGAPKVKSMELTIIGDNTARAQAFEAGDLDLIQSPLSPQDIKRLAANSKFSNAITSGLGVTYINFNTGDPLLADPKIRRALAMLIDQKTIVEQIYAGVDKAATSVLLPSSWAYSDQPKQPTYDPAGAAKLFTELGWAKGGDGMLAKGGQKLKIVLATHSEDPNRIQTIEFIQAQMKTAGVDTEIRISDFPSFSTGYVQKSMHQFALLGWLNLVDPDRLMYGQLVTGGPLNWGKYSNPKVDAALQAGRSALKQEDRKKAYLEAATVLADEIPYYILSYQGYQLFYSKSLGSLTPNPRGYLRSVLPKS